MAKPENQVYQAVVIWSRINNFWLHRIESKATYSSRLKMYTYNTPAPKGFPDVCGLGPNGEPVFIELKAKGKRSTLRIEQYQFLKTAIERQAFAVCIDDIDDLATQYQTYTSLLKDSGYKEAAKYLLSRLPVPKVLNRAR